jgi:hypothetical protein
MFGFHFVDGRGVAQIVQRDGVNVALLYHFNNFGGQIRQIQRFRKGNSEILKLLDIIVIF